VRALPQRGGTLLGFILGVLVGLAGALAVAVYVTKVPVPFVDRVISRKAADDAAEAERNKNWDPNATLNGKPAKTAAEAAPAPAATPAPVAAPAPTEPVKKGAAPAPAAGESSGAAEPAPKGKTYSSDPLGDLAQSKAQGKTFSTAPRPANESGAATGASEPFLFFVQVGAYRSPEDAQAQRAKLVLMGLDAKISEREQAGRTVYRVRLGPYERQGDAEKMRDNLEPNGFEAALVRVQR
jgi:cell division protein FtsN